jgi:hypothetical protein
MLYPAELHAQGRYNILSRRGLLGIAISARNHRKRARVSFGASWFLRVGAGRPLVRRPPKSASRSAAACSEPGAKCERHNPEMRRTGNRKDSIQERRTRTPTSWSGVGRSEGHR